MASEPVGAAETVRRLLAVQAQNLGGALWSVGQRAPGSTRGDVEAALAAGVVVLTLTPPPADVTVFPRVHLLPGFDEFHIGYADRGPILASEHQAFVGPGKNGLFRSPVVVDGVVAGIWSASERKGNIDVDVSLFPDRVGPILPGVKMLSGTEMRRAVETAATLYGRFLSVEAHAAVSRS
ncbi:crosslink repair DNA glycosylase YcaQ family protein [Arthrobacter sp. zg-Y820]|uniref:DNA glycosylase AlkZ-like family protein n=1 Tax=Arthrobacter sp. zg-Y820 TaxID=2894192 RepID=UPI0024DF6ED4|nr:crosslink repair DNA glycosylase YcaQ family protein [Arthrobacter sp. zg-Y820]WIB08008.1 crosslink repair DNA glycosylase YcaQ family protein [Arthrobacter sp. zg-Y820]